MGVDVSALCAVCTLCAVCMLCAVVGALCVDGVGPCPRSLFHSARNVGPTVCHALAVAFGAPACVAWAAATARWAERAGGKAARAAARKAELSVGGATAAPAAARDDALRVEDVEALRG